MSLGFGRPVGSPFACTRVAWSYSTKFTRIGNAPPGTPAIVAQLSIEHGYITMALRFGNEERVVVVLNVRTVPVILGPCCWDI